MEEDDEVEEIFSADATLPLMLVILISLRDLKKKKRKLNTRATVEYEDPGFIALTSVVCEWFFSIAGYVCT
jgi:hypothetical protein